STFEGQTSPKSITSSLIPAEEFGHYAADYMNDTFCGRDTAPFRAEPSLVIGESCGCTETNIPEYKLTRDEWGTDISEEGFDSVYNTMAEELLTQTELSDFIGMVYSYAFQIKGVRSFHLCLCDQWKYMDKSADLSCPNDGYSEKMLYAVRYNNDRKDGIAGLDTIFDSIDILPGLSERQDKPRAVFFTPVFFENTCYGYAGVEYGDIPRSYDETYRKWIGLVSRGIEGLRRYLASQFVQQQLDKLKTGKFAALTAAFDNLDEEAREDYELVAKMLDENLLTYHFQPIVNTVDGGIYSYEALMRSGTERRVPPLSIIKYADMQDRLADVEKATFFNVLDITEKHSDALGEAKVFINSIPGVKLSEEDMKVVEAGLERLKDKVVVELTEEAELSDEDLEQLKELFRRHDTKIAVDDYGTGYSNVNNLLRYMPNYVKIDRALLSDINNKPQKKHFVKEIISFCHDNDILALAEGVETSEELRTVIILGADLIQGYYTGRPAKEFVSQIDEEIRGEIKRYHTEFVEGGS
ncbi:MAG: EAL domain-containing protein, partial [Ruminococcus sp.]|nr:EAL domain-containing protein [Ruminococcus sp.]